MLRSLTPRRIDGYLPLQHYAAVGDGRSVALIGADGSLDWWCAPNLDSRPLFDRIIDGEKGGRFSITPIAPYSVERQYRTDSNVLETVFVTASGRAKMTESLNSGVSGRLPWCELARRIQGIDGAVDFEIVVKPTCLNIDVDLVRHPNASIRYIGGLTTTFCHDSSVEITVCRGDASIGIVSTHEGSRTCLALLVSDGAPLPIPPFDEIDDRIETSDRDWRAWTEQLTYDGPFANDLKRCALSLKFLLHSPTGAIAAAATNGLPERIGGDKNYDYRYAWVRDAAFTIKAFLRAGALSEPVAAFGWLVRTIADDGPVAKVAYTLKGEPVPDERKIDVPGYRGSSPIRVGNRANDQVQLSCYGDVLETAALFARMGHVLDPRSAELLVHLANQCCDRWMEKDSGIWELEDLQHYTYSKIGCWQALSRAVELAEGGHIDASYTDRWKRVRADIRAWIDSNCWSEFLQAYTMHPGSGKLDAAILLTTRFGFEHDGRLFRTRAAIERELAVGPLVYRYSGMQSEEGAFVACSCWLVESYAFLGDVDTATEKLKALLAKLGDNFGILNEQIDVRDGSGLGNMPQGLSHLALLHAIFSLQENR
jgi:GH15 family glucan-1,4-alpha-glucosidase